MENLTDEELIKKAKNGDTEAENFLMKRYTSFVKRIARRYFLIGYDNEDVVQEGMIGLFNAYQTFNNESSFKTYAATCIKNKILDAIKKNKSAEQLDILSYLFIDNQGDIYPINDDGENDDLHATIPSNFLTPEDNLISDENMKEMLADIKKNLSKFEINVLYYYLKGYSYEKISKITKKPIKSIDNALVRIRYKLKFLLKKNYN